jgi:chorismate synthase
VPHNYTIRHFASHADRAKCVELQEMTWGKGFTEKIPAAMLLVAQETGGITAGAFDESGTMLGFVFGVTGLRDGKLAHWSDMLAVRKDAEGEHIGEQLKEYQRAHCRSLGIDAIHWTYDPLVARNAHLNLTRMGARVERFVAAMYGEGTNSPLQGDMPTDRFVVRWAVDPAAAARPLGEIPVDAVSVVDRTAHQLALSSAARITVRVPRDITSLAAADLAAARRWRFSTRAVFEHYLAHGYAVRGFVKDEDGGAYLLERTG